MDYIEINKNAYNQLAKEYDEREHEIGKEFWFNIYNKIGLKDTNLKVLEIGPGNGRNIKLLKELNENLDITTIELSEKLCDIVKKNNPNVTVINEDIMKSKLNDKEWDIIEAIAVIHLFPICDARKLLKKINKALKDDGFLIIGTTINDNEMEGFYEKEDYNIKIKRFRHKYTKKSFEELLKECGFEIYSPHIIEEKGRNKLWYDVVVKKVLVGDNF